LPDTDLQIQRVAADRRVDGLEGDLPQLTGLRGIAALLVLFYHVRTPVNIELEFGFADAFPKFGFLGVDVFFVLSGFVLSLVYNRMFASGFSTNAVRAYGAARFARIYPLHFATLLLMLGAYWAALRAGVHPTETSGYSLHSLILSLFLVQEWFGVVATNPGSWSISIEFANYLLFPLLMLRPKLAIGLSLALIFLGAVMVELLAGVRVLRGMSEFAMGFAAYGLASTNRPKKASALSGLVFVLPFIASKFSGHDLPGLAALSFAVVLFLLSGTGHDPFKTLCASKPLVFIGNISYSVYLLQWFIWIGWKHVLAKLPFFSLHPKIMVGCAAASVVLCAIPSYCFFEKPTRAFLRRLGKESSAPRPAYP
jgi:peptidoglycan/LPS O-acetylase OafA/YrhL